jgi:hypothetical protein
MFGIHANPIFSNPVFLEKSDLKQVMVESEKLIDESL